MAAEISWVKSVEYKDEEYGDPYLYLNVESLVCCHGYSSDKIGGKLMAQLKSFLSAEYKRKHGRSPRVQEYVMATLSDSTLVEEFYWIPVFKEERYILNKMFWFLSELEFYPC